MNYLHLDDEQDVFLEKTRCKMLNSVEVKSHANLFSIVSHIVTERLRRVERVLARHGSLVVVVVVGARRQAQHAFEGALEVGVAQRVEDGVERRVDVAQPDGGRVELGVDAVLAERHHHEQHEVRQPAQHERAHDHAQLPRRLFLLLQDNGVGGAAVASRCERQAQVRPRQPRPARRRSVCCNFNITKKRVFYSCKV